MDDDWKGERFIRKKPTPYERMLESQRVIAKVVHEKKRREGTSMGRSKAPWAKTINAWFLAGKKGED